MPHSVLTELHIVNSTFGSRADKCAETLADGLKNSQCKLEALRLVKLSYLYDCFVTSCTDFF